jgi:hypothetical protein
MQINSNNLSSQYIKEYCCVGNVKKMTLKDIAMNVNNLCANFAAKIFITKELGKDMS